MKSHQAAATAAILVAFSWAVGEVSAQPRYIPVPYALVQGSSFMTETVTDGTNQAVPLSPLRGGFKLVRTDSPLDEDAYVLFDLQAFALDGSSTTAVLDGTGSYVVRTRIDVSRRMQISARVNGRMVSLDSGVVAPAENQPVIDITLQGEIQGTASPRQACTLHVVAVPDLQHWRCQLLTGSTLLDDCPPCDRLSIPQPMTGEFDLVLFEENPLTSRFALCDIAFVAGSQEGATYRVTGGGWWEVGGEVAVSQTLTLQTLIQAPGGSVDRSMTNDTPSVARQWPAIQTDLTDTAGNWTQVYHLRLQAAPKPAGASEIWFSTVHPLTSANRPPSDSVISPGDVLSTTGQRVRANADLLAAFGIAPVPGGHGIDAICLGAGGEVLFSLNEDIKSGTVGLLQHGDLLSEKGVIVETNQKLLNGFHLMPPVPDVGLDAAQVTSDGEVLFSTRADFFSESQGGTFSHGDLLSDRRFLLKTNRQLLAAFHPEKPDHDYGLDALYVWPSGEIWFSTEEGFQDASLGPVTDGDLLSDYGYVIRKNLDLVGAFSPLEDLANFGLDAIHVVLLPPRLLPVVCDVLTGHVSLRWQGNGGLWQVERTLDLSVPFAPVSPIITGNQWSDATASLPQPSAFYRVRQW